MIIYVVISHHCLLHSRSPDVKFSFIGLNFVGHIYYLEFSVSLHRDSVTEEQHPDFLHSFLYSSSSCFSTALVTALVGFKTLLPKEDIAQCECWGPQQTSSWSPGLHCPGYWEGQATRRRCEGPASCSLHGTLWHGFLMCKVWSQ